MDDHLERSKKGYEIISELKSDPDTENVSAFLTSHQIILKNCQDNAGHTASSKSLLIPIIWLT